MNYGEYLKLLEANRPSYKQTTEAMQSNPDLYSYKRRSRKKYVGEENETVTLKDCQAANMKIAKLRAGQLSPSDFEVPAPDFISVGVR